MGQQKTMKIAAQIFGLGAMISLFCIYQQKSRKGMLLAKLSADICWVVHYLCLGGFAGMIPNGIGIFRELIFINRKEKVWASSIFWPGIFIVINWLLGFRTFSMWYNILPILASTVVTVSLWIDNPKLTKCMTVPISLSFLIYDVFIGSYIGVINELISIASIALYFIRSKGRNKDAQSVHE